ncbi:hypothetical protein C8Q80DRAFT_1276574 [Daedaleopsis nitida]|nr:hypothetical protein C8Q80DRAFT_1276574 [Daedaleopsis nitida]
MRTHLTVFFVVLFFACGVVRAQNADPTDPSETDSTVATDTPTDVTTATDSGILPTATESDSDTNTDTDTDTDTDTTIPTSTPSDAGSSSASETASAGSTSSSGIILPISAPSTDSTSSYPTLASSRGFRPPTTVSALPSATNAQGNNGGGVVAVDWKVAAIAVSVLVIEWAT